MDARTYLSQARLLNNRIRSYENELEYINTIALGPSGPSYGPNKIKQAPSLEAPFVRYIDKIMELEKIIHDEISKLIKLKQNIARTIAEVGDAKLEIILRERYINCRNWEDIAIDLAYSQVYLYKLHQKAIKLIKVPSDFPP
ncbi:MAG: DUF1492 domain-containing protein [Candidatus Cloacimonetes bacterium]|jgi:hypothetical protein|nr:DUF1492 domain-containing protein [Candidatus Cloacimonadota bacterium]MCK9333127.1 DUF1492 domain-containing protein [Candidatus Cloacimonadota bacterium]